MQLHKANVSFTPKCHALQAHQVEKTGKLSLLWKFVMALKKRAGNPTEYVEDDIGCHFHLYLHIFACTTQTEIKRKNNCGLAQLEKGYVKEKTLITLVLVLSYSMSSPNKFNGIVNGIKNYIKEH